MEQPFLDVMADYGDEMADHIVQINQLRRMRQNNLMIAGPVNEDEDSESQRKPTRRRKRKNGSQL